jgi:hypothetical protein
MNLPLELLDTIDRDLREIDEILASRQAGRYLWRNKAQHVVPVQHDVIDGYMVVGQ